MHSKQLESSLFHKSFSGQVDIVVLIALSTIDSKHSLIEFVITDIWFHQLKDLLLYM